MNIKRFGICSLTNQLTLSIIRIIKWLAFIIGLIGLFSQQTAYAQTVISELPFITLDQPAISNIYGTDWSPDGRFLAVATNSGLWIFTPSLNEIAHLTIPTSIIYAVDWNADGTKVAGGGIDGKVHIWDVKDLNHISVLAEIPETEPVVDVEWSPNETSHQIAVRIVERIEYLSDTAVVYSTIHIWDTVAQQIIQTPMTNKPDLSPLAWNALGDCIAMGYYHLNTKDSNSRYEVALWNVPTGQMAIPPIVSAYQTLSLAWQPHSSMLATTDDAGYVSIYNDQLEFISGLEIAEKIYSSAWNPTGKTLAVGTEGGSIYIWDMDSGTELGYINGHDSTVNDLDWSPDAVHLVSSTYEGVLKIWDMSILPTVNNLPTVTPFPH